MDSNVILYLLSADTHKADRAETVLAAGAICSVQVLNEVANVARRKLGMSWPDVRDLLETLRSTCSVEPLTVESHARGLETAERLGFSVYDAMIVAAALLADCDTLWSEDMQDGQLIDGTLRIRNPFASAVNEA